MKERPILFSGAMVRAILAGTKTQTRREVKPKLAGRIVGAAGPCLAMEYTGVDNDGCDCFSTIQCPHGQPGDRLWVREAFAKTRVAQIPGLGKIYVYRESDNRTDYGGPWKPSIHMPRAACRIVLEIVSVRVERLNDICGNDCIAEGAWRDEDKALGRSTEAIEAFSRLWQSVNGEGSWAANPWVWVIEFKRVEGGAA